MGPRLWTRAYAKVNLALEILGRRDDGFHEIVSVTQTISLHDSVECASAPSLRVRTEPAVVAVADNLAAAAAELLARETRRVPLAELLIRKRIPLAAGLGGGSTDAAATLRLLDRLWRTRLGRRGLAPLAARLGSDVPLFLAGGTALIQGRGELVRPLPAPPRLWLAVASPSYAVPEKTRALYRAVRPNDWSDGSRTRALADRIAAGIGPLPTGEPLPNAFDRAAASVYEGFGELRDRLAEASQAHVQLSGAGPSLFALFRTRGEAVAAVQRIGRLGVRCDLARSIAGLPPVRTRST